MEELRKLLKKQGYEIKELQSGFSVSRSNVKFTTVQKNGKMNVNFFKRDEETWERFLNVLMDCEVDEIYLSDDEKLLIPENEERLLQLFNQKKFQAFLKDVLVFDCLKEPVFEKMEKEGKIYVIREGSEYDKFIVREIAGGLYDKRGCYFDKTTNWLDVGANIGAFGIKHYDVCPLVVMYEAEAINCKIIREVMKVNGNPKSLKIIEAAIIGGGEKSVDFFCGKSPYSHSTRKSSGKMRVTVKAENINDVLTQFPMINSIKLDCEGSEYEIIKNISKTSWKQIKQLVCEFHFNKLDDVGIGAKWNEVMNIVRKEFKHVDAIEDIKQNWNTIFYCRK